MQFRYAMQKMASLIPCLENAKMAGNLHRTPSSFDSEYSCVFQPPMNSGKYAYMAVGLKHAQENISCVSNIPWKPFFVFLSTVQLTSLLLKRFHLRLHSYTQTFLLPMYVPRVGYKRGVQWGKTRLYSTQKLVVENTRIRTSKRWQGSTWGYAASTSATWQVLFDRPLNICIVGTAENNSLSPHTQHFAATTHSSIWLCIHYQFLN